MISWIHYVTRVAYEATTTCPTLCVRLECTCALGGKVRAFRYFHRQKLHALSRQFQVVQVVKRAARVRRCPGSGSCSQARQASSPFRAATLRQIEKRGCARNLPK